MDINLSAGSVFYIAVNLIVAVLLFSYAYKMATGKTQSYNGVLLHGSSRKRGTITRYSALLGILFVAVAAGFLFNSNAVIFGVVNLCWAVICLTGVSAMHNPPKSVGVFAKTEKGKEVERYISYGLSLLLGIEGILNLWPVLFG